jgi:hypothetical protein
VLGVGPRMVQPRTGLGAPSTYTGLHDLLKKDVDHCRDLPVHETMARSSLVAACDFMLARIRRAAIEADGGATPVDPQQTVDNYFAAIRAKDIDALMVLYAEAARFTLPNGKCFEGKPAIRELHSSVFAAGSPMPHPGARFAGAEGIAVEIVAQLPDGSQRHTTNHYRFDDAGRIVSLGVYARG